RRFWIKQKALVTGRIGLVMSPLGVGPRETQKRMNSLQRNWLAMPKNGPCKLQPINNVYKYLAIRLSEKLARCRPTYYFTARLDWRTPDCSEELIEAPWV